MAAPADLRELSAERGHGAVPLPTTSLVWNSGPECLVPRE